VGSAGRVEARVRSGQRLSSEPERHPGLAGAPLGPAWLLSGALAIAIVAAAALHERPRFMAWSISCACTAIVASAILRRTLHSNQSSTRFARHWSSSDRMMPAPELVEHTGGIFVLERWVAMPRNGGAMS